MKTVASVHQQRISAIYDEYRSTVFPLVAFLEANDAEFPIEILNEIRGTCFWGTFGFWISLALAAAGLFLAL